MAADRAADLALLLFAAGVVTTFGVRTRVHLRRTGSSGFSGISGPRGSAAWWGGVLFVAALVLAAAALTAASLGAVAPLSGIPAGFRWAGMVGAVAGFTLAAQSGMGVSWRIGVNHTERTDLVTTGLCGLVRNPIFTAMWAALAGLTLMALTPLTVSALVCLVLAVELQVRVVEEPYLAGTHGEAYDSYARRVGRFLPAVGRVRCRRQPRMAGL